MTRKPMISESEKRTLREAKKVLNSLAKRYRKLRTEDFINRDVSGSESDRMYTELRKLKVYPDVNYDLLDEESVQLSLRSLTYGYSTIN